MILTIFQAIDFIGYVAYIWIKYGKLPSISDSWYKIGLPKNVLFWIFLFILGLLMMMQEGDHTYLFQISGAGLWLTGTFAPFKDKKKIVGTLHVIGAYTSIFTGLAGLVIDRHTWIPLISFAIVAGLIKWYKKKHYNWHFETWWIEIAAFVSIIIGLFLTNKIN